jgi:molybdenum cofactor synthesis domain-containing protein
MSEGRSPTAAIIVIGDEILSGKFVDENTPYLIHRLRALGADLRRAVIIPDDLDEIEREVRLAADRYDLVFTTGGVGPTHDDMTLEGIARAFGVPLVTFPKLVALLEQKMGAVNEAALRMTRLPRGSHLLWEGDLWFPLVVMGPVHIFPGVPSLMKKKFEAVAARFEGAQPATGRVTTIERESAIAARLEEAVRRWPQVSVGSYPRYEERPWRVIVTLEGRDAEAVEAARAWLTDQLVPFEEG